MLHYLAKSLWLLGLAHAGFYEFAFVGERKNRCIVDERLLSPGRLSLHMAGHFSYYRSGLSLIEATSSRLSPTLDRRNLSGSPAQVR